MCYSRRNLLFLDYDSGFSALSPDVLTSLKTEYVDFDTGDSRQPCIYMGTGLLDQTAGTPMTCPGSRKESVRGFKFGSMFGRRALLHS